DAGRGGGARSARVDHHQRHGGLELPHRGRLRRARLPQPRLHPGRGARAVAREVPHRAHHHPVREPGVSARGSGPLTMTPEQYTAAWTRRPASAVSRLGARQLLVLSARDLLAAAKAEGALLVALIAPAPAPLPA